MQTANRMSETVRATIYGLAGFTFTLLAIGIPTDVIPNPIFTRMLPVRPQDYVFLIVTALLGGLLAASYALPQANVCSTQQGKTTIGGFLSFFAIGCPTCNKIVVLLLGAGGAVRIFEPIQPILAAVSMALLAIAVWVRWRPVLRAASVDRRQPLGS
ncbi:MAG TPA: hypothetical protein PK593_01420 [Thermomicrobiales bacterium]|nr:hypothetical protein [Chloroflexota bacterium]HQX62096.1 hypothetical protein [Thermomicrobiales bacterium]HQZ90440.1 hypothetical protein [Thermomicrobiales bacterium]HRA31008.1 hypothetical protein [Thermomicrobiales bacterium]